LVSNGSIIELNSFNEYKVDEIMGILNDTPVWENTVYQLEKTDLVVGGEGGVSNVPLNQLANRTQWLKRMLDTVVSSNKSAVYFCRITSSQTDFDNVSIDMEYSIFRQELGIGYQFNNVSNTWEVSHDFVSGIFLFDVDAKNLYLLDNDMLLFSLVNV
jgi:hypothetical protein